ncbi:Hint domain-containing protein [Marivita hallyeonensis]|uniref:Hint domain-containing protein n=1 Tax=Marivita hallyeonensis TaxID=996342 RepID=A0A1M5TA79_9RHOB|nr:Hint domain-containing protein [Marivita hallyeonensis]SHH47588.1 Hint domain-containing protein [Marivita hallyeonensis]
MATYDYPGYDDDQITWPGGTVSNGDTITFTQPADHLIQITDDDTRLQDGTDDRDDEDGNQTAVVYDEFGAVETSGQVQPRDEITLTDGTNTFFMTEIFIAATNSYYYIFHDPAPQLGVQYTVTSVTNPNTTDYSELSTTGVACFTAGTRISTPSGDRRIETLRSGDMVTTLDRGAQPILWIGQRWVSWREMRHQRGLRPFLVRAHSFGPGRPSTDTRFSRQHRVLLNDPDLAGVTIDPGGALASVHTLTALPGIEEQCPMAGITYFHILTEAHNLVLSNGLATETLLLTAYSKGLTLREADVIIGVPPEFCMTEMRPARAILKNQTAREFGAKLGQTQRVRDAAPAL